MRWTGSPEGRNALPGVEREELRPTRDVDFLARWDPKTMPRFALPWRRSARFPVPEDGVVFDPATIRLDDIRDDQQYGGLRARIRGSLGQARLTLQVDIGFGDVITPQREEQDYPTLLDLPLPLLWTYPRETLVAEKFEAMVRLGVTNSRVKDLWDVACLVRRFAFDGETLQTAVEETFHQRGTLFAGGRPVALLPSYYQDSERGQRWQVLQRRIGTGTDGPTLLVDAGEEATPIPGSGLRQPCSRTARSRRSGPAAGRGGRGFTRGRVAKDRDRGGRSDRGGAAAAFPTVSRVQRLWSRVAG